MLDELELFKEQYKIIKNDLEKEINKFNKELESNKNGYLKENLQLFTNLNKDGKLIRGFLITLGYKLAGKNNLEYTYPLATAYELFQTSVLIHDDIIDEDNLRRGKETIHYSKYLKNKEYDSDFSKKIGNSVAICMGDYGFFEANKIINNNYSDNNNYVNLFNYYNDIVLKTIEGELIDVELSFDGKYRADEINLYENIMKIYKLKTAYYTIIGPLNLGLILAGSDEDKINQINLIGEKIGIAFQIQDDILGIYSDMGKVIGSDIKEFKQTLLYSYTLKNEEYKNKLLKYYGKEKITKEEIEKVREIFNKSGAYNYAINTMNTLYDESLKEINTIKWINENDKKILIGFIQYLRNREK